MITHSTAQFCVVLGLATGLAHSHVSAAEVGSPAILGSIQWQDMDPDSRVVRYIQTSDGSGISIKPKIGYLDSLRNGKPITAEHFWWTPFEWKIPEISVKTQNSTDHSILLNKLTVSVKSSTVDETPIPIFLTEMLFSINFFNDGWGSMMDASISYGILGASYCQGTTLITDNLFSTFSQTYIGDVVGHYSIDLNGKIPFKYSSSYNVCAVGVLSYKSNDGKAWRVPYRTLVLLRRPGVGAPAPPNATYDLFLEAGKSGYQLDVPLSQEVPAKGTDNFNVSVFSDKSANFSIFMKVLTSDNITSASADVQLSYFRPKSVPIPQTPEKLFKSAESKGVDLKQFGPYVTDITFDPVKPKEFVITATEEWMFLTQNKRTTLHERISQALGNLNIDEGNYCYRLNDQDCVKSGTFRWSKSSKNAK